MRWQSLLFTALDGWNFFNIARLPGNVSDTGIEFSVVDDATQQYFLPLLTKLQSRTFFKYFKVNLSKDCPFWEEADECFLRDCSLCECDQEDVPSLWREEDSRDLGQAECKEQVRLEKLCSDNSEIERNFGHVSSIETVPEPWKETNNAQIWTVQDDADEDMMYANLEENPERFTGYSGASAQRVWRVIYMENCFDFDHTCREKRVFFRLLSGLQSSITTQVALDYRFENGRWDLNLDLFLRAVGWHEDRLTNMYFVYIFLLRAIGKLAPRLEEYDFSTGNSHEDAYTKELVHSLAQIHNFAEDGQGPPVSAPMCMTGFDESQMFQVSNNHTTELELLAEQQELATLKEQYRVKFHNISMIMDCVGCEKCKLWGKLETLGIGTALKIMLATEQELSAMPFNRNEIIALVNTVAQLAKSVGSLDRWKWREVRKKGKALASGGLVLFVALYLGMKAWGRRAKEDKEKKAK